MKLKMERRKKNKRNIPTNVSRGYFVDPSITTLDGYCGLNDYSIMYGQTDTRGMFDKCLYYAYLI